MKFSHRVIVLSVTGCLLLFWLVLTYMGVLAPNPYTEKLNKFLKDNPVKSAFGLSAVATHTGCRASSKEESNGKALSTLDLVETNDYNLYVNGEYEIPNPKASDAYKTDLEPLTVIILPHSHVDPGWLETLDMYYNSKVNHILNNMVKKMTLYEDLTFVWAEIVFFSRWWDTLNDMLKSQVRSLVESGRLEIALGGWIMPDEASTHYVSVIDQLMEGHQWVMENLGTRPVTSWSIDPFGHSGTMPYLWKKAGMENMVIQRIHQATKGNLVKRRSLEFWWQQYWDLSGTDNIRCHVMPYILYSLHQTCGPDKFTCAMFDFQYLDREPMFRAQRMIHSRNIVKQAASLYEQYRMKAGLYQYNTILVPLGDDFRFNDEQEWDQQYMNYKKLMVYMNGMKDWKINVKFGTLKDYFKAIQKVEQEKSLSFPTVSGDFFPYSDHDSAYWTGYFTTRPFDKRFSREVEANLRAAEILNALAFLYTKKWGTRYSEESVVAKKLQEARRDLHLFLHHDAITGTARTYVVLDYEKRLLEAFNKTHIVMQLASQLLLSKGKLDNPILLKPELVRADSFVSSMHEKIDVTEDGIRIVMFNPVAQARSEFVELVTDSFDIKIVNSKNQVISYQINPVFASRTQVHSHVFEVVFLAELAPLALETFFIMKTKQSVKSFWSKISIQNSEELIVAPELKFDQEKPRGRGSLSKKIYIENEYIGAEFAPFHGTLTKVVDKKSNNETDVEIEFMSYVSRGSGAYIFYPDGNATKMSSAGTPIIRVIEGPFVSEVQVVYRNLFHRVKLYNHPGQQGQALFIQNAIDMQVLNMRDREMIMRLRSKVNNANSMFFTDQNGYQLIGRKNKPERKIETNYYPMTTMAALEDQFQRLTLHSGQPHGVASLAPGWLEVMLDRQLMYDDGRGLAEGIGDNKLTMSKFILQLEHKAADYGREATKFTYPSLQAVVLNEFLQQPIQKMYTDIVTDVMAKPFHPVPESLPCDISIVSFRNLVKSDLSYNGTSLILHRKGYQCGFPAHGLQCTVDQNSFSLPQVLPVVKDMVVKETTLTHLFDKNEAVDTDNLQVPQMELKSFLLKHKSGE